MSRPISKSAMIAAALALAGQAATADVMDGRFHDHMYGGGFSYGGFGMMLLFWGGLIVLAVFAFRALTQNQKATKDSDAINILRSRLAKGEIDPEEYESRRKVLEG